MTDSSAPYYVSRRPALVQCISEVSDARHVLEQLVRQQLILRYRNTVLGYLWTLINPLMMMTITAVVFANLFKVDLKTFAIFMFSAMVPWNLFNSVVVQSASVFLTNEGLIKKIYLPKLLFPLSTALALLIDSILALIALFVLILFIGWSPSWSLIFLPVGYALVFCFAFGAALLVSVAAVFFRDLQHVILIVMQALFFLTPIIYEKTAIVGKAAILLQLNPITPFVELFRAPIRYGMFPDPAVIMQTVVIAAVTLLLGFAVFLNQQNKIVYRL